MSTRRHLLIPIALMSVLLGALAPVAGQNLDHFERARTLRVLHLLQPGTVVASMPGPAAKMAAIADSEGEITGVVTGLDRKAFESAHVVAWQADSLNAIDGTSEEGARTVARAMIAPDGNYRLTGLAPGTYFVSAMAKGYETQYFEEAFDLASATAVDVVDGEAAVGVNFALERLNSGSGSISGVVTQAVDGAPTAGAVVHAFGADSPFTYALAETDDAGFYVIEGLRAGDYVVEVWSQDHLPVFHSGGTSYEEARRVGVLALGETDGIDFQLILGGSISGVARDQEGVPLAGAYVSAMAPSLARGDSLVHSDAPDVLTADQPVPPGGWAVTAEDGSYRMGGLRTGEYHVQAQFSTRWQFATVWYDGALSFEQATAVAVIAGEQVDGIDMVLQVPVARSSISGRVTDHDGHPIKAFITVQTAIDEALLDPLRGSGASDDDAGAADGSEGTASSEGAVSSEDAVLIGVDDGFFPSRVWAHATTDEDGFYTVEELPAGTYIVAVAVESGWEYVQRWYPEEESPREAAELILGDSEQLTQIDFALPVRAATASISGTIRDQDGVPLKWAFVELSQPEAGDTTSSTDGARRLHAYGQTDQDGVYRIDRLPAGSYILSASYHPGEHSGQSWYDGAVDRTAATPQILVDDVALTGIDFDLVVRPLYGAVTGTVTARGSDLPVERAYVELSRVVGGDLPRIGVIPFAGHTAVTDEAGGYRMGWIPDGVYTMTVYADGGVADYVHPDTDALSTPFRIVGGERSQRDVALRLHDGPGGTISGRVSLDFDFPEWISEEEPVFEVDPPASDDPMASDDVIDADSSHRDSVMVSGGADFADVRATPGIAVVVARPATSTDPDDLYVAVTNADGEYALQGLPPGGYSVMCFAAGHIGMYYDGEYAPDRAELIRIEETEQVSGIDFELAGAYFIYAVAEDGTTGDLGAPADEAARSAPAVVGQVHDEKGEPIAEATVYLLDTRERPVAFAQTGKDGQFKLPGVAPGEYRVYASRVGFTGSYNGNEHDFDDADVLELTVGQTQVDLVLGTGIVTAVEEEEESDATPTMMALHRNFPNPFNPETRISFTVPSSGEAVLQIHNALGQRVATAHRGFVEAGRLYEITFRADGLASGVYFTVLQFDDQRLTRPMMLVR